MNKGEKLQDVTLVIPTHNRVNYLKRILDYYESAPLRIIVADSSKEKFPFEIANQNIRYYHCPSTSLPQKLSDVLQVVETTFVVMCADDDFTLPDAIKQCVDFLEQNKVFVVAQGNVLSYLKDKANIGKLGFSILYKDMLSFTIEDNDPMKRIERLLKNYKSIFYAVHYTENLQFAFDGVGQAIQNLYLNEYVTVLPLIKGNYAELPLLFQVREYSQDSGDKVTINLDQMLHDKAYNGAIESFLDFMARKICFDINESSKVVRDKVLEYFQTFAQKISESKALSFKKKVGNKVAKLPVVGKKMIQLNRKLEALKKEDISLVLRTEEEKRELDHVSSIILKHRNALV